MYMDVHSRVCVLILSIRVNLLLVVWEEFIHCNTSEWVFGYQGWNVFRGAVIRCYHSAQRQSEQHSFMLNQTTYSSSSMLKRMSLLWKTKEQCSLKKWSCSSMNLRGYRVDHTVYILKAYIMGHIHVLFLIHLSENPKSKSSWKAGAQLGLLGCPLSWWGSWDSETRLVHPWYHLVWS